MTGSIDANVRNIKIFGMGSYVPEDIVYSTDLDKKLGKPEGWVYQKSGVKSRRYATNENTPEMGAKAARIALERAGMTMDDIDCIVSGSGTAAQAIPCTAAFFHRELGMEDRRIPAFDISTTCLSFVTAIDIMSYAIEAGRFKNVLVISSDKASVGLNWNDMESSLIFGDGAAAAVIGPTPAGETSKVRGSLVETFSEGIEFCEIKQGGSRHHVRDCATLEEAQEQGLFIMNGKAVYKLAARVMPEFIDKLFTMCKVNFDDFSLVVPHQASALAMLNIRKKFPVKEEQVMDIFEDHGNQIAASVPTALCKGIEQGRVKRGDTIMLIGTSAGLSVSGMVLDY